VAGPTFDAPRARSARACRARCPRIGERSAHTWFVLHELLGEDDVKNYDGSWTEWGNLVNVPIEKNV
jgi:3-mercaptopyruvate sulfurtransferase SseA